MVNDNDIDFSAIDLSALGSYTLKPLIFENSNTAPEHHQQPINKAECLPRPMGGRSAFRLCF